jgi:hypothetical protein
MVRAGRIRRSKAEASDASSIPGASRIMVAYVPGSRDVRRRRLTSSEESTIDG